MSGYVPYEERLRRAEAEQTAQEVADAGNTRHLVSQVQSLLNHLGGNRTDTYLEVLVPSKGFARLLKSGSIVRRPGLAGGPDFRIAEVLSAYRLKGAMVAHAYKDVSAQTFDAYLVPDGRLWRFSGQTDTPNTLRVLAASVEHLPSTPRHNLESIKAALELLLA